MKRLVIILAVFAGLALVICGMLYWTCGDFARGVVEDANHHEVVMYPGLQVNQPGEYKLKDCGSRLKIEVKDMIVHFTLSDTMGKVLFTSGRPEASDVQRWHMSVDDSCRVWLHSSDIGNYYLSKSQPSGEYILRVADGPMAGYPANTVIVNGDTLSLNE